MEEDLEALDANSTSILAGMWEETGNSENIVIFTATEDEVAET